MLVKMFVVGIFETIWNSRDGVTPFSTACPSCGGVTLQHIAVNEDKRVRDHKLNYGQKFWRNITEDEALQYAHLRIAAIQKNGVNVPQEDIEAYLNNVKEEVKRGQPYLDINLEKHLVSVH